MRGSEPPASRPGGARLTGDTTVLLDAFPHAALIADAQGRILRVNPALSTLVSRSAKDLEGEHLPRLAESDAEQRQLAGLVASATADTVFTMRLANGEEALPSKVRVSRAALLAGEQPLWLVTFINLSQEQETEERLISQLGEVSRLSDTVIEQAIALKHYAETLEARVRERTADLHDANMDAILMLAVASEAKDADTGEHVRRIQSYAEAIAAGLGLGDTEAERIGYSAILHDVGKIHVPDQILQKPGPLTAEERAVIERHTVTGERILSRQPFFETARHIARSHHENWDGSGYPDGKASEAIPLAARIVHVADVFDALTQARVYKPAWSTRDAVAHLRENAGGSFEPQIVTVFERLLAAGRFRDLLPR